jgi:hypothetical protein
MLSASLQGSAHRAIWHGNLRTWPSMGRARNRAAPPRALGRSRECETRATSSVMAAMSSNPLFGRVVRRGGAGPLPAGDLSAVPRPDPQRGPSPWDVRRSLLK